MNLTERIKSLEAEFAGLSDWEARYRRIVELGKQGEAFPEDQKIEANKVKGCQSQVWLSANQDKEGFLFFKADSDALIVKGLVQVLVRIYSGSTPQEILSTPADFLKSMGFESNLSQSRTNGLNAMVKQIGYYALAFNALKKSNH